MSTDLTPYHQSSAAWTQQAGHHAGETLREGL